jgi:hypothetical protein
MKGSFLVVSVAVVALSWSGLARAHSDGTKIAGYSGLDPSKTCNSCHSGGTPSKVTFIGPTTLAPGAVGDYQVVIANSAPNAQVGGVDIAADNPQVHLSAAGGTDVQVGSDLVHESPVAFVNGEVTFSFTLTAPMTPGIVTVYADGMEANLLDNPTSGDLGTVGTMKVGVGMPAPQESSASGNGMTAPGGMGCSASRAAGRPGPLAFFAGVGLALGLAAARRRRGRAS